MEFFFCPHGRFDRNVEITQLECPIGRFPVSRCTSLIPSRFCGKQEKAAPPPAQKEMCSEPANERVEGDEQSEAPEPPKEEEATVGAQGGAEQPQQGAMDDTWDEFE